MATLSEMLTFMRGRKIRFIKLEAWISFQRRTSEVFAEVCWASWQCYEILYGRVDIGSELSVQIFGARKEIVLSKLMIVIPCIES